MVVVGLDRDELVHLERVCLCQYTLGAVVLVGSIFILEIDGVLAREDDDVYTLGTDFLHSVHVGFCQGSDQLEVGVLQVADAMCEVVGGSSVKVGSGIGGDNLITGDMPDAANSFIHFVICLFRRYS